MSWSDGSLKEIVRLFVYECLHRSDPEHAIELLLTRRLELGDISGCFGMQPPFWVQLRLSGRGIAYDERTIEDLLTNLGYRCDEWGEVANTAARLGIFQTQFNPAARVVVCLKVVRGITKCDLFVPAYDCAPAVLPQRGANGVLPALTKA
jgi:hypothetical protein